MAGKHGMPGSTQTDSQKEAARRNWLLRSLMGMQRQLSIIGQLPAFSEDEKCALLTARYGMDNAIMALRNGNDIRRTKNGRKQRKVK